MIEPTHLFVLDPATVVFVDGYCGGKTVCERVAVSDYHDAYWMPGDDGRAAYKAAGWGGDAYIPKAKVRYIIDLTDDDFRPVEGEALRRAV